MKERESESERNDLLGWFLQQTVEQQRRQLASGEAEKEGINTARTTVC